MGAAIASNPDKGELVKLGDVEIEYFSQGHGDVVVFFPVEV